MPQVVRERSLPTRAVVLTIYFRLYGYKAGASGGTWRIDNLNIQGTVNGGGSVGTGWYIDSVSVSDSTCCGP